MYQFVLKSKKYGDHVVSIDDVDKPLLFKLDADGKDKSIFEWYLGYIPMTNSFYAFHCDPAFGYRKETLSHFLTQGRRVYFSDGDRLNCCRNNLITRSERNRKLHKKHFLFDVPDSIQDNEDLYFKAQQDSQEYKPQSTKEIQSDVDAAWELVQDKYNRHKK